jgi:dTDP-4-amino-4,6-dideoxygalactose transaminase
MSQIPLVDLKAQHQEVAEEVQRGFAQVLEKTAFILGPAVTEFETNFARFQGVNHCVGVANGTDALELMVRAAGIGPGDEVILPANTFIATPLAVARAGATPVMVDVDPRWHLIDVEQAARKIGPRTKALLPVHLYGQLADMEALGALAREHELVLLEDAAQVQGARRNGRAAGGFGLAAATSFYPGKNLGAYGDAGAVLTNAPDIHTKLRALRNYGGEVKYHHPELGFNSRLDTFQAVVLNAKLSRLANWNAARLEAAQRYDELLRGTSAVTLPETMPGNEHVWHLYVIRVPRRDEVLKQLNAAGVGAGIHYPIPCHLQGAFKHLGHKPGDFPVTEKAAGEILSLPLFPQITAAQQERVVDELRKAIG